MPQHRHEGFTFAAAPYANAVPLAHFLTSVAPGVRVVSEHPARLSALLAEGSADAALVPIIDLFDHPFHMIEGLGVCAEKAVESVLLKCHRPIEEVRTVALSPASHTSNALACVLLREHLGMSPQMAFDLDGPPDAAVVIGDLALASPPAPCGDLDLATLWHAMTALPFVFAVWACPSGHPRVAELTRIAYAAKQAGLAAIGDLARLVAANLGLAEDRCRRYLESVIYYDVGPRELAAIEEFRTWVRENERFLPPRDPRPAVRPLAGRPRP